MKYIDVSQWQGEINWEKVKPNIDGAIIRAGYGKNHIDGQFVRNVSECNRLNIPCGAYWFSYATTAEMAKEEAEFLLNAVKPYRMELPLAFDFEYDSVNAAQKNGVKITKNLATQFVYSFCGTIESYGYWCVNYSNPDFLSRYFAEDITKRFGLWLAMWPKIVNVEIPPRSDCQIWQWGTSTIPGINGDVDTNESYVDFKTLVAKYELNHLADAQEDQPAKENTGAEWALENGIITEPEDKAIGEAIYRYHKAFGVK